MVGKRITSDLYLLVIKREAIAAITAARKETMMIFFLHLYNKEKNELLSKMLLLIFYNFMCAKIQLYYLFNS